MNAFTFSHLSDGALLHVAAAQVAGNCSGIAAHLAQLAEIDARKLYLPAAYPSMYAFCMGEWHFSEDVASNHIRAARTAREFPVLFAALAEGRLSLSAVLLLASHLTTENVEELIAAATHQSKAEIVQWLAERFPRPGLLEWVTPPPTDPPAPGPVGSHAPGRVEKPVPGEQPFPGTVDSSAPGRMEAPRARVVPLGPGSYGLQCNLGRSAYEDLRYAQSLLGYPSGDAGPVFERALRSLVRELEKQKFAATSRPRSGQRCSSASPRHIPAAVKREVWQRDGGQCTFVSEKGQRCPARTRLEFDHAESVARGGMPTVGNLRLRCRAHNQYAAERMYGAAFMSHKREEAQRARATARVGTAAEQAPEHVEVRVAQLTPERVEARTPGLHAPGRVEVRARAAVAAEQAADRDVVPWLRSLGFRAEEARRGAEACEAIPEASLEERLRLALSHLAPPRRRASMTS